MKKTNEYQDALNKIKPTTSNYELIGATNTLQKLIDKETPIQPTIDEDTCGSPVFRSYIECPVCETSLNEDWNGCPMCVREIDWGEEE